MHPPGDPLLYKYFHKKTLPTLDPDEEGEPALELAGKHPTLKMFPSP